MCAEYAGVGGREGNNAPLLDHEMSSSRLCILQNSDLATEVLTMRCTRKDGPKNQLCRHTKSLGFLGGGGM
jgi:hypothetical protein